MTSLRQKQQEIRNEKLNRLRNQFVDDSKLKVRQEYNRLVNTSHNPKDAYVKELIKKRVEDFKENEQRWAESIKQDTSKTERFQEREGNDTYDEIKLLLEKVYDKLTSEGERDYFIYEDISKLKKILYQKLYLLKQNQIRLIGIDVETKF
jgi:hypothetical protein